MQDTQGCVRLENLDFSSSNLDISISTRYKIEPHDSPFFFFFFLKSLLFVLFVTDKTTKSILGWFSSVGRVRERNPSVNCLLEYVLQYDDLTSPRSHIYNRNGFSSLITTYWPSSFLACLWTSTSFRPINTQEKRTWPMFSHHDLTLGQ